MQQLWPRPVPPVDPGDLPSVPTGAGQYLSPALTELLLARYVDVPRSRPADRPWVLVNMVATLDGAIADAEGRSGGLSGPADRAVFHLLRESADVIVVGAGTARAENYGPVRIADAGRDRRLARGRTPLPRLAVVSGRAALDPQTRLFEDPEQIPYLVTTESAAERAAPELLRRCEVIAVPETRAGSVDLTRALAVLGTLGHDLALCEGGPSLNAELHRAGAIDELCLTTCPLLVGGAAPRSVAGAPGDPARPLGLAHLLEDDGFLLQRWVVSDASAPSPS